MAEIPKNVAVDLDFIISEKTVDRFCGFLTDYLTAHPDKEIQTFEHRAENYQGDQVCYREVRLVTK